MTAVSTTPIGDVCDSTRIIAGELDVVIVSYNTRDLLLQCLASVYAAEWEGSLRVFVVDNGSTDGSVEAVRKHYPSCEVIVPGANLGFARANNLALRITRGEFALLLNPDTVVGINCFQHTATFLREHPRAAVATCRLELPNGKLDLACRRSFPTLWNSICRATCLSFLFPKSPTFAGYNLTYLDEAAAANVECVCGAYMLVKREVLDQVGLLDEDYFMYGEDADWCFRIKQAGWDLHYLPQTTTIHYKGQSSNQRPVRMIREFFKGCELYFRKNYFPHHAWWQNWMVLASIRLWYLTTLGRNALKKKKSVRP